MSRIRLIQLRRGTAAQWTSANPTLASGEGGFETDTKKLKLGDGSTAWNSLAYIGGSGSGDVATDAIWDAKGDLAVGSGSNTADNLAVGTNGFVLTADSGQTLGVKWATPASVAPSGSAGGALDGTYPNPGLNATVAGAGLAETSDVLSVNVDGSTIEISSDSLRVKDGGITAAKVAADVATQAELDAHTGDTSDAHDASAISVADSGGYFTATDVEAALAEIGAGTVGTSFGVETPSGTVNGVNTAFTLSATPAPSVDLLVFKNGILMKQTLDYTLSGTTVTFDSSQIPQTGDILLAAIPTTAGGGGGGAASDGWIDDSATTWTYASADAPTFTFTVPGNLTSTFTPGKRLKLTQTTVKYFIVTASSHAAGTTTVTIYGGTDYTLANAAISANYHSADKAPDGFPLDPAKWTVELSDTSNRSQSSPVDGTWYNLGTLSISIPIGCWRVYYGLLLTIFNSGADTYVNAYATMSTANNTESDTAFTTYIGMADVSGAGKQIDLTVHREKTLTLAAKTSYFLNGKVSSGGTLLQFSGGILPTIARAVCAYL